MTDFDKLEINKMNEPASEAVLSSLNSVILDSAEMIFEAKLRLLYSIDMPAFIYDDNHPELNDSNALSNYNDKSYQLFFRINPSVQFKITRDIYKTRIFYIYVTDQRVEEELFISYNSFAKILSKTYNLWWALV